ncbi:putative lipopolysaccharide heptosyltransferase III [Acidiferrobacter thiooxydans]|nr:putative lipopolysaccharide heptosyltransferase III [Acidiferrobacter thiooxydans]
MDKPTGLRYCDAMLPDAIDPAVVRRALVIKFRHHGDVLLAAPVFRVLRALIPKVEVDALIYEDSLDMLRLNPDIATIHTIDRRTRDLPFSRKIAAERRLLTALKDRHYDLIVHLTEHPRGAVLARILKPRYAVARRYPGRRGRWWRKSFTHLYDVPARQRHTVETHLDALRRLGLMIPPEEKALRLVAGPEAWSGVDGRLTRAGLAARPFLVIHPTSRWLFKAWPATSMTALIRKLQAAGHTLVVTSGPDAAERQVIGEILAPLQPSDTLIDWSGTLTLKELAALLQRARLFIGVDSAPMHMASAMGTPVVAIFGPSGDQEWAPWQVPARVLTASTYSCRPCGFAGCGDGQLSECMGAVGVDEALQAITDLLEDTKTRACASS